MMKIFYLLSLSASCGLALWKGGNPERVGASIILAGSFLTPLVESSAVYTLPEYNILLLDIAALVALLVLALSSDRFWPLWTVAFHVLATIIHIAKILDPDIWPLAYAHAQVFWAYPMLLALALGTWMEASEHPSSYLGSRYGPCSERR